MKKIPATPFARRNLDKKIADLRDKTPADWGSAHLRRAHEIVEQQVGQEKAKEIVIEAVRAAHRALKQAYQEQLGEARRPALADLSANCRAIANTTKPRLKKEIREKLDYAARSAFGDGVADLETVQLFFCECRKIVEEFPEVRAAALIFKHLVTDKDDLTHGKISLEMPPMEINGRPKGRWPHHPKIALDYEAIPAAARSTCEAMLTRLISERRKSLTAHDVFECIRRASSALVATATLKSQPKALYEYLADLDAFLRNYELELGRGNHPEDTSYRSPLHEFAERVLLEQRDPGSRLFDPVPAQGETAAKIALWEIARTTGEIPNLPSPELWLIGDRTFRTYLERRSTFKKSR
ncbi:hypothetical protein [Bradyrhizobium japonicum]|uniref:hypothetical protein n=1 Tax=Bradyrhizobium japonicum TaxID=375 RepID=UPI00200FB559|nr:hypothetical protein [Bradyrhizobium japonicum]UQD98208.1 hypothetical protein JEY30_43455 [Bradyrhizobium japonicum]